MFGSPGPSGPLDPSPCPHPPCEEDVPRARDRRRAPTLLEPDPRQAPARSPGLHLAPVARAAVRTRVRGRHAARRGPAAAAAVGREALRPAARVVHRRGARRRRQGRARRGRQRERGATAAPVATGRRRPGRRLQPAPHVRPVRDRRLEPARPRRGARRGGDARARLQPAVHLRAARARQDAPAALDRQLRHRLRRRRHRPLHDRRGVHEPLRRLAPRQGRRGVQGRVSRRRRAARRRRAVPPGEGCRPSRSSSTPSTRCTRRARRSCSRPTACRATSTRSSCACASASRPASSPTSARPTRRPASRSCASASSRTTSARSTPAALELIADRVTDNVRTLEGALVRVVAFGSLTGRPVTAELAAEVLAGLYPELRKRTAPTTVAEIQERTAEAFGISVDAPRLQQPRRRGRLAAPDRHVPRARAHRAVAARDRQGLRRAQPHDRACTRAGAPPERIAGDPEAFEVVRRLTESLDTAGRPVVTPRRLTDCLARVHTRRTASDPQLAGSPAVVHTIHNPYDGYLFMSSRPESNVK